MELLIIIGIIIVTAIVITFSAYTIVRQMENMIDRNWRELNEEHSKVDTSRV